MPRRLLIGLLLAAATLAVYAQVLGFDFVSWDDPLYVSHNPHVSQGLSWVGVRAAFSEPAVYWHPLVTLSHMLDVELFGMDAGAHHRSNLLLHLLNSWLVFLLLDSLTRSPWRSAVVAALFALHPLHVEAVAWISSRKDLVSTLFGLLALAAYTVWARRRSGPAYGLAALALALGLMAKPMLVSLPALFLLLDYWPLGRLHSSSAAEAGVAQPAESVVAWRELPPLLLEKLPFVALAAISSALTLWIQARTALLSTIAEVPFTAQLANAVVSYARYLGKTVWPTQLSVLYPHPNLPGGTPWTLTEVAGAALLLLAITALVLALRRQRYLLMGWLWFVGALIPAIGLVKFGTQAMADRFSYVPHIGLFVAIVWGAAELAARLRVPRAALAGLSVALLFAYGLAAHGQAANWANSLRLYQSSLAAAPGPPVLSYNLANLLLREGRLAEAVPHYRRAVELAPDYASAHNNLATALRRLGQPEAAQHHFRETLRVHPDHARAHRHLGDLSQERGDLASAVAHYRAALAADPGYVPAHLGLGRALTARGELAAAVASFAEALRLQPGSGAARQALEQIRRQQEAAGRSR